MANSDSITNLIISKEEIKRFSLFPNIPEPEPGIAIVLYSNSREPIALVQGQSLTAGEKRWGNFKQAYKVDMTEHNCIFNYEFMSQSEIYKFIAEVSVTYQVEKPAVVINKSINNPEEAMKTFIKDEAEYLTKRYEIEMRIDAEDRVNDVLLGKLKEEMAEFGLKVRKCRITLSLNKEAQEHLRKIDNIRRDAKLREEQLAAEGRLKNMEAARQAEEARYNAEVLKGGLDDMLGLIMAKYPNKVDEIMHQYKEKADQDRADRRQDKEVMADILRTMLNSGKLESHQYEDLLRSMSITINQVDSVQQLQASVQDKLPLEGEIKKPGKIEFDEED